MRPVRPQCCSAIRRYGERRFTTASVRNKMCELHIAAARLVGQSSYRPDAPGRVDNERPHAACTGRTPSNRPMKTRAKSPIDPAPRKFGAPHSETGPRAGGTYPVTNLSEADGFRQRLKRLGVAKPLHPCIYNGDTCDTRQYMRCCVWRHSAFPRFAVPSAGQQQIATPHALRPFTEVQPEHRSCQCSPCAPPWPSRPVERARLSGPPAPLMRH